MKKEDLNSAVKNITPIMVNNSQNATNLIVPRVAENKYTKTNKTHTFSSSISLSFQVKLDHDECESIAEDSQSNIDIISSELEKDIPELEILKQMYANLTLDIVNIKKEITSIQSTLENIPKGV